MTSESLPQPSERLVRNIQRVLSVSLLVGLTSLAVAGPAAAQSIEGPLQSLVDMLTGAAARLIAILAIVVFGFLMMSGRFEVKQGLMIVGGIILVFGAATIADQLIGGAGG